MEQVRTCKCIVQRKREQIVITGGKGIQVD